MKKTLLFTLSVAMLAAGCSKDCDPTPDGCVSGTLLANTCGAGTLIQLDGSGGTTIWYDVDGKGKKKYKHVIAAASYSLNASIAPGQTIYFTIGEEANYGGPGPTVCCFVNDAPEQEVKHYTLLNVSTVSCNEEALASK
jgi:hypothetical protein